MKHIYSFEKLDVWQESRKLVALIYSLTKKFPEFEKFGLSNQMQRSAVSVPSNIAEGVSRSYLKEQIRFIEIAYGSLMELYCQLIISLDLGYLKNDELDNVQAIIFKISNKLNALKNSILSRMKE